MIDVNMITTTQQYNLGSNHYITSSINLDDEMSYEEMTTIN